LGSGCGLVGIAAGFSGAKEVILTDLSHALPLIGANIDRHRVQLNAAGCEQMTCKPCDWFRPLPEELLQWQPQVLLVADCVWMQELVAPLLATIRQFTDVVAPTHPDVPVIIRPWLRTRFNTPDYTFITRFCPYVLSYMQFVPGN
jgi:hypothetical protein